MLSLYSFDRDTRVAKIYLVMTDVADKRDLPELPTHHAPRTTHRPPSDHFTKKDSCNTEVSIVLRNQQNPLKETCSPIGDYWDRKNCPSKDLF